MYDVREFKIGELIDQSRKLQQERMQLISTLEILEKELLNNFRKREALANEMQNENHTTDR